MTDNRSILTRLAGIIQDRKQNPPPRSYTTSLMQGGGEKIGAKVLEEAAELVDAARQLEKQKNRDSDSSAHLVAEAADLTYHLLVMLGYFDLTKNERVEHFTGIRLGCWINAIPVGGLVMVQDATDDCICSYQNKTWVALQRDQP